MANSTTQLSSSRLQSTLFKDFRNAGIDLYTTPVSQSPDSFKDLYNVMPATNGAFTRRWGAHVNGSHTNSFYNATVRTFSYNVPQDSSDPTNTVACNMLIATDNKGFQSSFVAAGATNSPLQNTLSISSTPPGSIGSLPSAFSLSGSVYGVVSRRWFYYGNGIESPKKVNPSYLLVNGSRWGIPAPVGGFYPTGSSDPEYTIKAYGGVGVNYVAPTVTISGAGSGATASANVVDGHIVSFPLISGGTGYTSGDTLVTITDASGVGAAAIAMVDDASGAVTGVFPFGNIRLASQRQYTYAYKNSSTGHTSGYAQNIQNSLPKDTAKVGLATVVSPVQAYTGNIPDGVGFDTIYVSVTPIGTIDNQVDTLVLLATSDGGSLEQLYEVTQLPLNFASPGTINYPDQQPDSYPGYVPNGGFVQLYSGPTLLSNNLWVDVDIAGSLLGIADNQVPPNNLMYFTLHLGRIFATDGYNLYYSKNIQEVTTSTGLITCKWEEAWPGDNQLPISIGNEVIRGLKSDGTRLHIGTTECIYTLNGDGPNNFSVPGILFAKTGVLSHDTWNVIYAESSPVGYMWVTPDLKILYSDFNTYQDAGLPIYPFVSQWDNTYNAFAKLTAFSYGPFSLMILSMKRLSQSQADLLVFETRLGKWYRWSLPVGANALFTYQHPPTGFSGLFFSTVDGFDTVYISLDPNYALDFGTTVIPYAIETNWQDFSTQDLKVVNQLDILTSDPSQVVTIRKATTQADWTAGAVVVKTGPITTGPFGTYKFYSAGSPTAGMYLNFRFESSPTATPVNTLSDVLDYFNVEYIPMTRV